MRRLLELSLVLVVIGFLGFFGTVAMEKSILNARKKVLLLQLQKIGQNLETYYAEYNRLPDVANLTKAMGLSVCKRIQNPSKNCIKLNRVNLGSRHKFWSITTQDGIIYYNNRTGESRAIVKSKKSLRNVATLTFNRRNGVPILKQLED